MQNDIRSYLVFILLACLSLSGSSFASEDWQIWLDQGVSDKSNPGMHWSLKQQERWSEDFNTFSHYHVEAKLSVPVAQWLRLTAGYRQQYVRPRDAWQDENRPLVAGTFKGRWQGIDWQNRNRFEVRFRDGRDTLLNYRNRTMVTGPKLTRNHAIRPYLFDEFFIDSRHGELYQNRVSLGLKGDVNAHLKADTYGMWLTSERMGRWEDVFIIGGRITLAF